MWPKVALEHGSQWLSSQPHQCSPGVVVVVIVIFVVDIVIVVVVIVRYQ